MSSVLKDELYLDEEGDCKNKAGRLARTWCFEGTVSNFECLDSSVVWQTWKEKKLFI